MSFCFKFLRAILCSCGVAEVIFVRGSVIGVLLLKLYSFDVSDVNPSSTNMACSVDFVSLQASEETSCRE